jgi:hypothetical protein
VRTVARDEARIIQFDDQRTIMRVWAASAINSYYLDPPIEFLQAGNRGIRKPTAAGYYIVPHCSPGCCQAFGGISVANLGPFATRTKARTWSRTYLTEPIEPRR